ncbi:collagenase [Candidatus Bathyarchaeota archaeon]|nr:collagenase [Candidatus Bathyarchaeota archaeon]
MEHMENDYFKIILPSGYCSDANQILDYATYARNLLNKKFPFKVTEKVRIFLYEEPTKVNGTVTCTVMRSDYINLEIHAITPSKAKPTSSWIDDDFYHANIIHEYVHVFMGQWIFQSTGKQMKYFLAEWFSEGIAGYIPYYHSTPEICQKYSDNLEIIMKKVRDGRGYFDLIACDVYYGGAVLVRYMFERYGQNAVRNIITGKVNSWIEAVQEELGISYREFKDNWLKWACEDAEIDVTLYF